MTASQVLRAALCAAATLAAVLSVASARGEADIVKGYTRCYHSPNPIYGMYLMDGQDVLGYCPREPLGYRYANPMRKKNAQAAGSAMQGIAPANEKPSTYYRWPGYRPRPKTPAVTLNINRRYQKMDGFGASLAFFTNFITFHPNKEEIYSFIFNELRPTVLRLRNSWEQPNQFQTVSDILDVDEELVREWQSRVPNSRRKLMMTAWTPPARLKANNLTEQGDDPDLNTLRRNDDGEFVYDEYADWWVDSLTNYRERGVEPDLVSIQNEPDFTTTAFVSNLMTVQETENIAGYVPAFKAVQSAINKDFSGKRPQLIGPESTGLDSYLEDDFVGTPPAFPIVANHLYAAGDQFTDEGFFENLRAMLINARALADEKGTQKLYQTEYANLADHQPGDPLLLARVIHECLTVANVNMYLNWDLAWGRGFGEGTLMLIDNPFNSQDTWGDPRGYSLTRSFWWFRHFARYVDPGMVRIECTATEGFVDILPVCFAGADGKFVMIMINVGTSDIDVRLEGIGRSFSATTYYSTLDLDLEEEEPKDNVQTLRAESITTVIRRPTFSYYSNSRWRR